ncbi:MAG: hydantoinase/oxoprolinase family protein, partial [Chloroflexi bacterium]|nr:hydantoinase/oxoprolinase family protein [Chloroflexota bacterium]
NENERLKTLLIQCYIQETARKALLSVEGAAKAEGYKHELMTILGYGAAATIRYPKLVEAIVSGPTSGLLGCKFLSEFMKRPNMVGWDLGCTTCDIGLIAAGLRMPMIAIDSIGAGCSHVVHVDVSTGRITVGPDSVRAALGTMYASDQITIGDIDLALGYVNPDYYLGGTIQVNKARATAELTKRVAEPLGQDVYDISLKILDLIHAKVADHMNGILLSKGLNPAEFTLMVYGAAGPTHLWGLGRAINFAEVIITPWAAVFSAFGAAAAEYFHRYDKAVTFFLAPQMPDPVKLMQGGVLSQAWAELEERGYQELEAEGFERSAVKFRHGISCRYIGQLSNWEVPVEVGRVNTMADMDKVIGAFEKNYTKIYPSGARYPEAGYQITEVYVEAVVERPKPVMESHPMKGKTPPKNAYKGQRKAFFDGEWINFDVWEQDRLEPGNRVDGPAIIEHTQTTLVLPPQNYIEIDQYKFMHYLKK